MSSKIDYWDKIIWIDHRYDPVDQVEEEYENYVLEFDCPSSCLYCGDRIGQWLTVGYGYGSDYEVEIPTGNAYYIVINSSGFEHVCEDCMEVMHHLGHVNVPYDELLPHEVSKIYRRLDSNRIDIFRKQFADAHGPFGEV